MHLINQSGKTPLLEDATYLLDELSALENLIECIPYLERPAEEDSIFDFIARIDFLQTNYYLPLAQKISEYRNIMVQRDNSHVYIDSKEYRKIQEGGSSMSQLIDSIKTNRQVLLTYLNSTDLDLVINQNKEEKKLSEIVEEMIYIERKQLQYAAERIVTFERMVKSVNANN